MTTPSPNPPSKSPLWNGWRPWAGRRPTVPPSPPTRLEPSGTSKGRTGEGLERAREQGKVLGPPRKFTPNQVETMRRMREGGTSLRRIAAEFECSANTVRRALLRERVG